MQEYSQTCSSKNLKFTQTEMAIYIGTTQPTVSRELKRFKDIWWAYNAYFAQQAKEKKREEVNKHLHTKVIKWSELALYIEKHLKKKEDARSPEQIAWTRNLTHPNQKITHPTIYKYIYEYCPDLVKENLKRHGKKYNFWKSKTKNKIPNRISIHDRPPEIETRERLWDFEWDTIVWSNKWDRMVTAVDRKSGFLLSDIILQKNEQKLSIATSMAIFMQMKDVDRSKLKTITFDNWVEFFDHEYLCEQLWILTFFADPYSSRQRWTNENTNGLIRFFFPKWTDFSTIDPDYFRHVIDLINNRPRKRLWWKTPAEVFLCSK